LLVAPTEAGLRNSAWNSVVRLQHPVRQDEDQSELNLSAWINVLRALPVAGVAENDVLAWVEGPLRQFFPFEKFLGSYAKLLGGRAQILSLVTSGHSTEFLSELGRGFDLNDRGCVAWWVSNRKPFILHRSVASSETGHPIIATSRELDDVNRFSLGAVAAHGVIDRFVDAGTYISFAGVPTIRLEQTFAALRLIAPVLHALLLQTKQAEESALDLTVLTDRQRELVEFALKGLSDKAIAKRLVISEHTVGNHFRAIYAKLGISKRSQLTSLLK
jgi:DNA-binding CsgD family transcriptional regulator